MYFLRHDPDIDFVIAVIDETIEANAIIETADHRNVVFKPHI